MHTRSTREFATEQVERAFQLFRPKIEDEGIWQIMADWLQDADLNLQSFLFRVGIPGDLFEIPTKNGSGDGSGSGDGYGSGYGDGSGDGSGDGYGEGSGGV